MYDLKIGLLIILLIPLFIWGCFQFKGKVFVLFLLISFSFVQGSIHIIFGEAVTLRLNQLIELCIIIFMLSVIYKSFKLFPGILYFIGFISISLISFFINDVVFVQLLLFLRMYLLIVVIYVLFLNIDIPKTQSEKMFKYIVSMYILQISIGIIKYYIVGQSESYIGTMSLIQGSLTTIFSLVGISFSFSAFIYTKKYLFTILILFFLAFAFIGGKRAVFIYTPILLLIIYLYYIRANHIFKLRHLTNGVILIILIGLIFYFGIRLMPILNPEGEIYGSFDVRYAWEAIHNYLYPSKDIGALGRGEAPYAVYKLLIEEHSLKNFLIGLGPGDIILSRAIDQYENIRGLDNLILLKYGIGYGARTGVLFTTLQVGILGALLYFMLVSKMFYKVKQKYFLKNQNKNCIKEKLLQLGLIGTYWIFIFDFIFYSRVMYTSLPMMLSIFFTYYYISNNFQKNV